MRIPSLVRKFPLPLFGTALLAIAGGPAQTRPQAEPMRGAYFGSLLSTRGDQWSSDFNIVTQNGRSYAGDLTVTGRVEQAIITGTCSNGHFTLTSHPTAGQTNVRFRMTGTIQTMPNSNQVLLQGTYVMRGVKTEKGTVTYQGALSQ